MRLSAVVMVKISHIDVAGSLVEVFVDASCGASDFGVCAGLL